MKIEAIQAPSVNQLPNAKSEAPVSARDRAIAALMKPQGQELPVRDATRVSPEETSVVRPPSSSNESISDINESAAPETKADTKVSSEPLSAQYAMLARREKQIRQREQQFKAREAEAKAAADAAKAPPKPEFDLSKYVAKDTLTQDPFKVLGELGLTYDQLTELAMNAPKPEQLAMLAEMKALKAEMESLKGETKKSFEEQQNQQRVQAMTQIRNEVKALVRSDAQFETIKATNSVEDVVSLIEQVFDKDGILLSVEEAASQVEEYLIDEAMKIAKLSKIQQRLQPKPAETKPTTQTEKQPLKTLTNSIASSRQLSARDRAVLAFQNKLTK